MTFQELIPHTIGTDYAAPFKRCFVTFLQGNDQINSSEMQTVK